MSKIVISYRRSDSDVFAGRIRDRLAARFGEDSIFIDVDNIPFGTDFRVHIQGELAKADAILVVVGHKWLGAGKGIHARIMDDTDPVRIEVEAALGKGIPIIPVLVGNTVMPKVEQLPESLKKFAFINAATVATGRDFHRDLDRVIGTLDKILGLPLDAEAHAATTSTAVSSGSGAIQPRSSFLDANRPRHPSKALTVAIAGIVALVAVFGSGWWLWGARTQNVTKTGDPMVVGTLPSANDRHTGGSAISNYDSQGTVRNPADGLSGSYRIQGVNPNGSRYTGQVTVTANGDVYNFRWRISNGDTFVGSGRLQGRIISVDWGQQYPVVYRIDDDGTLRGTWANGTASEDLVPIR